MAVTNEALTQATHTKEARPQTGSAVGTGGFGIGTFGHARFGIGNTGQVAQTKEARPAATQTKEALNQA